MGGGGILRTLPAQTELAPDPIVSLIRMSEPLSKPHGPPIEPVAILSEANTIFTQHKPLCLSPELSEHGSGPPYCSTNERCYLWARAMSHGGM